MPSNLQMRNRLFLALLVTAALVTGAVEQSLQTSLVISGIDANGTNLVITALVPSGLRMITLETRARLDDPWTAFLETNAPAVGGEITFVIPKTGENWFMRLAAQSCEPPN